MAPEAAHAFVSTVGGKGEKEQHDPHGGLQRTVITAGLRKEVAGGKKGEGRCSGAADSSRAAHFDRRKEEEKGGSAIRRRGIRLPGAIMNSRGAPGKDTTDELKGKKRGGGETLESRGFHEGQHRSPEIPCAQSQRGKKERRRETRSARFQPGTVSAFTINRRPCSPQQKGRKKKERREGASSAGTHRRAHNRIATSR